MTPPLSSKLQRQRKREILLACVFLLVMAAFAGRLVQLQVVEHSRWRELAERQMYNTAHEPMPRGEIRDRNGMPMAVTLPLSYAVGFRPSDNIPRDSMTTILSEYLPLSSDVIRRKLDARGYTYLARRVDWQVQQQIEDLELPSVFVDESVHGLMEGSARMGVMEIDGGP